MKARQNSNSAIKNAVPSKLFFAIILYLSTIPLNVESTVEIESCMATRVSRVSGQNVLRTLRAKSPRSERSGLFIGLKRNEFLSDVSDPGESLNNILEKISLLNKTERELYGGPYDSSDWAVTSEFVDQGINQSYLLPLSDVSIGGGSLGNTVSLTPRIRIEDRINFAKSFFGEDSFTGLHSGPDAQFYVARSPRAWGKVKFSFSGSSVTVSVLQDTAGGTLNPSTILAVREEVILSLAGYGDISLVGQGISLSLKNIGGVATWTVYEGLANLQSLRNILGVTEFNDTLFSITQDYSALNRPDWFEEDPDGGEADNSNPETSMRVLKNESGVFKPLVNLGYWFTGYYVEERWTPFERSQIGSNGVVQDSNMRWFLPPDEVGGDQYNWGIRWDGYLRVDNTGHYAFQVETNVSIKIDIYQSGSWSNVFDTKTAARETEDRYLSNSFEITGSSKYVPITIRLFNGGPDIGFVASNYPNLFIKTTPLPSQTNFYSESYAVTLSGTVLSGNDDEIKAVINDTDKSVNYRLIDSEGNSSSVNLSIVGTDVTIDISLPDGEYTLVISPDRSSISLTALWKGRIASPPSGYESYANLIGYDPDILNKPFDLLPDWWKISQGYPNTPIDGFVPNTFKSSLKSLADGTGLYGDGAGNYTSRPNIILGEAKYSGTTDQLGSNYIGLSLKPNRLGEGGKLVVRGYPVNNSTFSSTKILGASDIGAGLNEHLTIANGKFTHNIARLYRIASTDTYFLHSDLSTVTESDDPVSYGLPSFTSTAWLSPITVTVAQVADDQAFTVNPKPLVAPLVLFVEVNTTETGYSLLEFSTTQPSLIGSGGDIAQFSGKYVKYYTEANTPYLYSRVDSGEGFSFSDVLKLTYEPGFNGPASEVPRPVSDRVLPFGSDDPDLCYPPYDVSNPLLSDISINDIDLSNSTAGYYDVFWGNQDQPNLEGKTLTVTEKIEFVGNNVVSVLNSTELLNTTLIREDYTHRLRFDIPLDPSIYDDDILQYIGNGEKVKDSYYCFVKLPE
jgi:hypothetical protein